MALHCDWNETMTDDVKSFLVLNVYDQFELNVSLAIEIKSKKKPFYKIWMCYWAIRV